MNTEYEFEPMGHCKHEDKGVCNAPDCTVLMCPLSDYPVLCAYYEEANND